MFSEKFAKNVVGVKPEVVVYFGLLLVLKQVGVAESEKRVAAIFLLPVWAPEPPERSFRPYTGSYGCLVARRRPDDVAQPSTPTTLSVQDRPPCLPPLPIAKNQQVQKL